MADLAPDQEPTPESIGAAKLRALTAAAADRRLGDGAVRLLAAALDHLCRRDGPDYGAFWCSVKTLADDSTLSTRAVARWLVQLVSCGYLDRVSTGGGRDRSGVGRAAVYRLATLPKLATLPLAAGLTLPNSATLPVLTGNPATGGSLTLPLVADNPSRLILENDPETRAREDFSEFKTIFWPAYPLKNAEAKALKAWQIARGKAPLAEILGGLERYKAAKPDWQQWAHADRWLAGERWRDQVETSPAGGVEDASRRRRHALWAIDKNIHVLTASEPTGEEIAALVREGAVEIAAAAKFSGTSVAMFAQRHGFRLQSEMVMGISAKRAAS